MAAAQIPRGPARATHNELTVSAEARTSTRRRTEVFTKRSASTRQAPASLAVTDPRGTRPAGRLAWAGKAGEDAEPLGVLALGAGGPAQPPQKRGWWLLTQDGCSPASPQTRTQARARTHANGHARRRTDRRAHARGHARRRTETHAHARRRTQAHGQPCRGAGGAALASRPMKAIPAERGGRGP